MPVQTKLYSSFTNLMLLGSLQPQQPVRKLRLWIFIAWILIRTQFPPNRLPRPHPAITGQSSDISRYSIGSRAGGF